MRPVKIAMPVNLKNFFIGISFNFLSRRLAYVNPYVFSLHITI